MVGGLVGWLVGGLVGWALSILCVVELNLQLEEISFLLSLRAILEFVCRYSFSHPPLFLCFCYCCRAPTFCSLARSIILVSLWSDQCNRNSISNSNKTHLFILASILRISRRKRVFAPSAHWPRPNDRTDPCHNGFV